MGQYTDMTALSLEPIRYDLESCEVVFGIEAPEPDPILKIDGYLVLSRGNISTVKGKAKAKKSFFVTMLVSMVLKQNSDSKVLLIDTEQHRSSVSKVLNRIYRLMCWVHINSRLKVLTLREFYEVDVRKSMVIQAIEEGSFDLVVLDGGVDIIHNFNDPNEAKESIGQLMALSSKYDCSILNVLHEGKTNGELRGHYGAEVLNKSETIFEVVKDDKGTSIVKAYATRHIAFDDFSFTIDETGLPIYNGPVESVPKTEKDLDLMKASFTRLLAPNKNIEYEALADEYAELIGKTSRTAKNHISKLVKINFIVKDKQTKLYRLAMYTD